MFLIARVEFDGVSAGLSRVRKRSISSADFSAWQRSPFGMRYVLIVSIACCRVSCRLQLTLNCPQYDVVGIESVMKV